MSAARRSLSVVDEEIAAIEPFEIFTATSKAPAVDIIRNCYC